jgi:hypothetical protein
MIPQLIKIFAILLLTFFVKSSFSSFDYQTGTLSADTIKQLNLTFRSPYDKAFTQKRRSYDCI